MPIRICDLALRYSPMGCPQASLHIRRTYAQTIFVHMKSAIDLGPSDFMKSLSVKPFENEAQAMNTTPVHSDELNKMV